MHYDIILEGPVGWDITPEDLRPQLEGKGDVHIYLNTYGGIVFDGLEIYNILNDHEGHVTLDVGAIAASSGGWLMLGADKIRVHKNSSWMTHRVSGFAWGNADVLRTESEIMEGLEGLCIDCMERRGLNREQAFDDMMKETWLFGGQAIIDAGLADELIDGEMDVEGNSVSVDEPNQNKLKAQVNQVFNQVEKHFTQEGNDFLKKGKNFLNIARKKSNFSNSKKNPVTETENQMNLEELKTKHPDLFNEVLNIGVQKEKDRNGAWLAYNDIDPDAVKKGIESNNLPSAVDVANFQRKLMNDFAEGNLRTESPGNTETGDPGAPEEPGDGDEPSEEFKKANERFSKKFGKGDS